MPKRSTNGADKSSTRTSSGTRAKRNGANRSRNGANKSRGFLSLFSKLGGSSRSKKKSKSSGPLLQPLSSLSRTQALMVAAFVAVIGGTAVYLTFRHRHYFAVGRHR